MSDAAEMTAIGKAVKRAHITVYEWRRIHQFSVHTQTPETPEVKALVAVIDAVRGSCDHQWGNRISEYGPNGLGAECVKCGIALRHDFDPLTDRGHPVGKTCRTCGATQWQDVEGVLCLIPSEVTA